jgi:pyruvate/2-oxoglutarate dehydrogenase complex dihydrolipoamide dehydrogenase (E3) component
MTEHEYDIIVIGCGSGGLSVGLFMNKTGFKVLMISKTDKSIGGDCLNDGCVPSKSLLHVSKVIGNAKKASSFGLTISGDVNIKKAVEYIYGKQEVIRKHENASWLKELGVEVALGNAQFTGKNEIQVNGKRYSGKKIIIATGSRPKKLDIPGIEQVKYYDNKNIFTIENLPEKLLVIGGGPIGIEIAQALSRLGSKVTIIHQSDRILEHDDPFVTAVLMEQLQKEGVEIILNARTDKFISANEGVIILKDGTCNNIKFDAIFVGIGRELNIEELELENAFIEVKDKKIVADKYLRTTNKNIFVCGDVAGSLQFSHAAEFQARIILNNLFSPFKKRLNNDHMSWVTFTDPELATFGLNEKELKERKIGYERLEQKFDHDDRAIVDDYRYGKMILYISSKGFLKKQKLLGGTMVSPNAGELIQELILANSTGLSINTIFNKIYPYPVASRINQKTIVQYKQKLLTESLKKLLRIAYRFFS